MGKRELLLVAAFVLVGIGVYQFTAPPADPSKPGFSISRLVNELRREVRGQRESAEGTRTLNVTVGEAVREIRVTAGSTAMTITGEDRADIEAVFHVRSSGYDKAEAERLVKASHALLRTDEAGALLILTADYPREGRQTGTLTLRIPARLGLRMDGKGAELKVTNVASVAIGTARGNTSISSVGGHVALTQRGSALTIDNVGSLRATISGGAETRLSNVKGDTTLNLQTGDTRAENLMGALEVEARNTEMTFQKLEQLRGPVRISANLGELTMTGLRTEARIDGRQTEIRIELAAAAPVGIYNEGDEAIELTLPAAGVKIDALATDGRISLDEALTRAGLKTSGEAAAPPAGGRREVRLNGAIRGGGPTVTLRASRGDIVLRSK